MTHQKQDELEREAEEYANTISCETGSLTGALYKAFLAGAKSQAARDNVGYLEGHEHGFQAGYNSRYKEFSDLRAKMKIAVEALEKCARANERCEGHTNHVLSRIDIAAFARQALASLRKEDGGANG